MWVNIYDGIQNYVNYVINSMNLKGAKMAAPRQIQANNMLKCKDYHFDWLHLNLQFIFKFYLGLLRYKSFG